MDVLSFLVITLLLAANAFFVAAEFALVKVRTSQIDQLVEQGHWAARITSRVLDRLDAYISASQLGITLASLGLGRAIEETVEPGVRWLLWSLGVPDRNLWIAGASVAVVPVAALLLVTFLHIGLGELVPKSLAIRAAKTVALWTAPPLMVFYFVFFPAIRLLNAFSDLVLWCFGMRQVDHAEMTHTEEELRHIVAESVAGGHLSRTERMMIENVLNLEEKTARRIMVPRADIVYLSLSRAPEENLRMARQAGHTRYPLCEDDLTTVIGMIHVKDLIRAGGLTSNGRPDLRRLARTIPFVPETIKLDELLRAFQRDRVHLAMLVDEYGSVVGMVTMENVLEELVGPIQDEFDREVPAIVPLGDGAFEVDGTCPLDVLAEQCGVEAPETEAETVGGLIQDLLGRLAVKGDAVDVDGHRLTVLQAEPTRIRRVRVEPMSIARAHKTDDRLEEP